MENVCILFRSIIVIKTKKLCARGNMIARKFKACSIEVKSLMFKTFCYSIYGAALWSKYSVAVMDRLRVNYNNILRRLNNVPPWKSASQLFVSLGLRGFREQRRAWAYSAESAPDAQPQQSRAVLGPQ